MGKKLIIKGADFSANGITKSDTEQAYDIINAAIILKKGLTGIGTTESAVGMTSYEYPTRSVIFDADLLQFSEYSTITITAKSGVKIALVTYDSNGEQLNAQEWTSETSRELTMPCSLYANIEYTNGNEMTGFETIEDFIDSVVLE